MHNFPIFWHFPQTNIQKRNSLSVTLLWNVYLFWLLCWMVRFYFHSFWFTHSVVGFSSQLFFFCVSDRINVYSDYTASNDLSVFTVLVMFIQLRLDKVFVDVFNGNERMRKLWVTGPYGDLIHFTISIVVYSDFYLPFIMLNNSTLEMIQNLVWGGKKPKKQQEKKN